MLTPSDIAMCDTEPDESMLRGALAGAIWTPNGAHRQGLRPDDRCPYCPQGVWEDEEHLLWQCTAWKTAREPFLADVMILARALKLGSLSEWPPCLRLCGLMLESVVTRSGPVRGPGSKESCRELNGISRH